MSCAANDILTQETKTLPSWFRQKIPDVKKIREMKSRFSASEIHTVCESALCPNRGRCWEEGTATFMILGEICTRACRFCAVKTGWPMDINPEEPRNIALAVAELGLTYTVITSVTRDDLDDGGAQQFVETIQAIRGHCPGTKIEVLIPDFSDDLEHLKEIIAAEPEVIGHNMETVRRLTSRVRPQADYDRSMNVIRNLKQQAPSIFVKSGIMVGLGESDDEVIEAMHDLLKAGCDILTVGQYLAPTQSERHLKVHRFVEPQTFEWYGQQGSEMGFKHVMSAPLVRSSYGARRAFEESLKKSKEDAQGCLWD